jgi:hypothetical protein
MIKQGIQSRAKDPVIRKNGCLALCLCAMYQPDWNDQACYNAIYAGMENGSIDKGDCTVLDNLKFIQLVLNRPQVKRRVKDSQPMPPPCIIEMKINPDDKGSHFIGLFGDGEYFDPLDPERPQARLYKPVPKDAYRRYL